MACITQNQLTDLNNDLAATIAHIAAIDGAMANYALNGTKSYTFDSGTGRQQEVFNSPMELIASRKNLAATRDRLRRELNGTSIITQRARY